VRERSVDSVRDASTCPPVADPTPSTPRSDDGWMSGDSIPRLFACLQRRRWRPERSDAPQTREHASTRICEHASVRACERASTQKGSSPRLRPSLRSTADTLESTPSTRPARATSETSAGISETPGSRASLWGQFRSLSAGFRELVSIRHLAVRSGDAALTRLRAIQLRALAAARPVRSVRRAWSRASMPPPPTGSASQPNAVRGSGCRRATLLYSRGGRSRRRPVSRRRRRRGSWRRGRGGARCRGALAPCSRGSVGARRREG
jgi:hypothetical protein